MSETNIEYHDNGDIEYHEKSIADNPKPEPEIHLKIMATVEELKQELYNDYDVALGLDEINEFVDKVVETARRDLLIEVLRDLDNMLCKDCTEHCNSEYTHCDIMRFKELEEKKLKELNKRK